MTALVQEHLKAFRLTGMNQAYPEVLSQATEQCWEYSRFFEALLEAEENKRLQNRQVRLLKQSKLPNKTFDLLNEDLLPVSIRRQLSQLRSGEFIDYQQNICAFGLPGRGKTHFLSALAHEYIQQGRKLLFIPAYKLVQRLLDAKAKNQLDKELTKLDRFEVIFLDDIGYIKHTAEEMEVLFTFIAERYERRSLMISSNLPFSQWDKIFTDKMTAMAAVDRLVQHSIILHFDGESIRVKNSKEANLD